MYDEMTSLLNKVSSLMSSDDSGVISITMERESVKVHMSNSAFKDLVEQFDAKVYVDPEFNRIIRATDPNYTYQQYQFMAGNIVFFTIDDPNNIVSKRGCNNE